MGGHKYLTAIIVGHIQKDGPADCDGRLKLHDIILHVNNISFTEISHRKAVLKLKSAGKYIRMHIKRLMPHISEEIQLHPPKISTGFSIVGSMIDGIGNNDTVIYTRNITAGYLNDQYQQLWDDIPRINKKPMTQIESSGNQSNPINKPLQEYGMGKYEDRKQQNLSGNYPAIDHQNQGNIALAPISTYKEADGNYTILREPKHHPIGTTPQNQINSLLPDYKPEQILVHSAEWNKKPRAIPSPALLEVMQLPCEKFLHTNENLNLGLLSQKAGTRNCDGNALISRIPIMVPPSTSQIEDIMKYGNCVKDLPLDVREFLEERGQTGGCSNKIEDHSGKYAVHRFIDPLTGRIRLLMLHIELDYTETHEEESDDYVTIITTYHYNITLSYE